MKQIISTIIKIRGNVNRTLRPRSSYFVASRSTSPLSRKFGFDRGKPIDRYWIEDFIAKNAGYIHGSCLEITDNTYTRRFGGSRVTKSDVLDIDPANRLANLHGDLRNMKRLTKDNTYDCIILTHVLGLIDDYQAAISECHRILKPGGVLLYTGSCMGYISGKEKVFWRFTPKSLKYILKKNFHARNIHISSYGNVLSAQCFLAGMSQEDLTPEEMEFNDPSYPVIAAAMIQK